MRRLQSSFLCINYTTAELSDSVLTWLRQNNNTRSENVLVANLTRERDSVENVYTRGRSSWQEKASREKKSTGTNDSQ